MTALDFIAAGFVFDRTWRGPRALAPKGRPDLVAELRVEVAKRVPHLRDERIVVRTVLVGQCDTCGDPLGNGRGGMCPLCVAARYKALVQLGRIAA